MTTGPYDQESWRDQQVASGLLYLKEKHRWLSGDLVMESRLAVDCLLFQGLTPKLHLGLVEECGGRWDS